jgi:hypothetical protein
VPAKLTDPPGVDDPGHRQPDGGVPGAALHRHSRPDHPIRLIRLQPLRMRRDKHPGVEDLHQPAGDDDLDRLTGERRTDHVVEPQEPEPWCQA